MTISLEAPKNEARRFLEPGHAGREALLCVADDLSEPEFDALLPIWVHLLRLPASGAPRRG